ncbi:hypothetical protein EDB86DRAFT_3243793 [Lactarius hatsudake]|nr:hypothetical protein EDB86DRAFT_3243793 [Lactarius hatsudake]
MTVGSTSPSGVWWLSNQDHLFAGGSRGAPSPLSLRRFHNSPNFSLSTPPALKQRCGLIEKAYHGKGAVNVMSSSHPVKTSSLSLQSSLATCDPRTRRAHKEPTVQSCTQKMIVHKPFTVAGAGRGDHLDRVPQIGSYTRAFWLLSSAVQIPSVVLCLPSALWSPHSSIRAPMDVTTYVQLADWDHSSCTRQSFSDGSSVLSSLPRQQARTLSYTLCSCRPACVAMVEVPRRGRKEEGRRREGEGDVIFLMTSESVEEVVNFLHILFQQGKVLYLNLGVSSATNYVDRRGPGNLGFSYLGVSKANQYAKDHGKTSFSVYQGNWSIFDRSFERDIISMGRSEGLALSPWGVLGAGKITEEARRREKGRTIFGPNWERTPEQINVSDGVEEIGMEKGTESLTAIAIAYHLPKLLHVFLIIGGRIVEQAHGEYRRAGHFSDRRADKTHRRSLAFRPGLPTRHDRACLCVFVHLRGNFVGVLVDQGNGTSDSRYAQSAGYCDRVPFPQPITPMKYWQGRE